MTIQRDDWDDDERRTLQEMGSELEEVRARHRHDPPFELLRAAHAEALPGSLQASLAEHLEQHAWSRALVDADAGAEPSLDADDERRLLARIRGSARASAAVPWYRQSWFPALAAAAVLVLMVAVLRRGEPPRSFEQPPPSAGAPAVPVPPAPVFTLPLDKPDVKLTSRALVLRSDGRGARFVDDIAPALKAYGANDYLEANRRLAALRGRYPASVEVAFYHAMTQLFLNDPAGATASLHAARRLDDGTFASDIAWYLAVAYERASDPTRARGELDSLCRGTSPYAPRACEAAQRSSRNK